MNIYEYIKTKRQAGEFPSMPVDFAGGKFWLCDSDWNRIDDPKNWFTTIDQARAYRTKMLDKKVKYSY